MDITIMHEMADKVWELLKSKLESENELNKNAYFSKGCYQNGREQGFSLSTFITGESFKYMYLCWAENRNSDQVVVYESNINPMQSIDKKMYENKKYFDIPEDAASYMANLIIDFYNKNKIKKESISSIIY